MAGTFCLLACRARISVGGCFRKDPAVQDVEDLKRKLFWSIVNCSRGFGSAIVPPFLAISQGSEMFPSSELGSLFQHETVKPAHFPGEVSPYRLLGFSVSGPIFKFTHTRTDGCVIGGMDREESWWLGGSF